MNYDDAFTLERVSDSLVDKFNYVAGIVPVLTTHLTQVYDLTCWSCDVGTCTYTCIMQVYLCMGV